MLRFCLIAFLTCLCLAQEPSVSLQRARSAPAWLAEGVIYQIWLRSFSAEGTLQGAAARLPYVAELGVTTVYLSPIQRMSTQGGFTNPYRIANYDKIDPEYGKDADLRAFTARAHQLGLKVLLDVVFYHTGPDNVLLQDHPDWYYRAPDGKPLPGTWGLPRLDLRQKGLRDYLTANLVRWVRDDGVDGYRCDVAAGVPLDFWEQARAVLSQLKPGLAIIAESDFPAEQLRAFDASYNFPWYEALVGVVVSGEPASRIREQWERARAVFPVGARLLRLNDNHDRDRADAVFSRKGAVATTVLNMTLDGIPFLYNGQEIGDTTPTDHQAHVPIRWDRQRAQSKTLDLYRRLVAIRRTEPALTQGDVVWVSNSASDSVVSFLRRLAGEEVLVVVNLSNRTQKGTVDLPVADYQSLMELIQQKRLGFAMAPGRVSFNLDAFGYLVAKKER